MPLPANFCQPFSIYTCPSATLPILKFVYLIAAMGSPRVAGGKVFGLRQLSLNVIFKPVSSAAHVGHKKGRLEQHSGPLPVASAFVPFFLRARQPLLICVPKAFGFYCQISRASGFIKVVFRQKLFMYLLCYVMYAMRAPLALCVCVCVGVRVSVCQNLMRHKAFTHTHTHSQLHYILPIPAIPAPSPAFRLADNNL